MFSQRAQTAGHTDVASGHARPGGSTAPAAPETPLRQHPKTLSHATSNERAPSKIPAVVVAAIGLVPSFLRAHTWNVLGYSETDRKAFALARANLDPLKSLEQIPSLALSKESDRKEIAALLLKKIPENLFTSLGTIGIKDEQFAFEVAHAAVKEQVTGMYYPWWRPDQKLSARIGKLSLSDEQKLTILTTVLEKRPHELSAYAQNLKLEAPTLRLKVASLWADSQAEYQNERGSQDRLFPLSKEWISNERLRAHIVKIAVEKAPHLFGLFAKAATITDPALIHDVARRAASSSGYFDYKGLKSLGIKDQKSTVEIFECGARSNPLLAVSQIKHFSIEDKAAIHRIVLTAADHLHQHHVDRLCFVDEVRKLQIEDRSVLQSIAHSLAQLGWMDASSLSVLGVSTRDEKFAFAGIAALHGGPPSAARLANLGFSDPLDTLRILTYASARHPLAVVMKTKHDYDHLDPVYKRAVYQTIIGQSPDGMAALLSTRTFSPQELLSEIVVPALRASQTMWDNDRGIYSVKVAENILEGCFSHAQALGIDTPPQQQELAPLTKINYVLRTLEATFPDLQLGTRNSNIEAESLGKDAALLVASAGIVTAPLATKGDTAHRPLALIAGLNGLADEPLGPREYRNVVELMRSIYEGNAERHPYLGSLIEISPDVWRTDFAGGLECVLSRAALYSIDPSILPERLSIDRSNVTEQRREIGLALSKALASRLDLSSDGDAVTLARAWGDLSPITVLLGRFSRSHPYEIPSLREVVEQVINGTFFDYRYDPERGQLRGFTPAMVEQWRRNPHRLTLCRASESSELSSDRALSGAQQNYAQLLLHLSQVADVGSIGETCSLEEARSLAQCKQDLFAAHYRQMEQKNSGSSLKHVIGSVGALLREGDREGASRFLRNFATIKARVGTNLPLDLKQQIFDDLSAISESVRERSVDKSKGYVVFTTLTDDPKLMMTVGDLVNTSSCQNFRTGSVVQTLLGYVMDGNIKASLSFAIAEGNLRNLFKIPHKQPFDPSRYSVSFDAPKLLLTLTDPEGQSHTISLGKAVRRRILRVGQREEDAQPAMFAERPYEILHAVTPQMEAEEAALLHHVEKNCCFRAAVGNIEFPASSNPAGVYSDHGHGPIMGGYMFKLPAG